MIEFLYFHMWIKKLQWSLIAHDRDAFDHSSLSKRLTGVFKMCQNYGVATEKPYMVFSTVEMCAETKWWSYPSWAPIPQVLYIQIITLLERCDQQPLLVYPLMTIELHRSECPVFPRLNVCRWQAYSLSCGSLKSNRKAENIPVPYKECIITKMYNKSGCFKLFI